MTVLRFEGGRRFGYRIVGLHPGAVRLSPVDTRDEVVLVAVL